MPTSPTVSPIITATAVQETKLYTRELVHSLEQVFLIHQYRHEDQDQGSSMPLMTCENRII